MSDAENFQQFQTHMLAFFGHMFNTVKVVVQSVPAAGAAGHLLQMAEASLNAAKVAAEETWKASEAPVDEPAPVVAPEPVVEPAPAPAPVPPPAPVEPTPVPADVAPPADPQPLPPSSPMGSFPNPDHSQT